MPTLRIVASVIRDPEGRWLLVRKRGTTIFMQPGGKLEPGESPDQALVRELHEELGMRVGVEALGHVGRFMAPAANEAGFDIDVDVYTAPYPGPVTPLAEIEEARWLDPRTPGDVVLAPLIVDRLLPLLLAGRL
ncbi:NUDIX hydrolase [Winogradskya humida]|uniref:DNA mismatch repair protein MutT n=1 Tax=Winogradskya humida TaxID=113566 RepID=A0ABQ3ZYT4_9ACTN|nr:NUDIX domain-containing protein [Actinoplanes humidus]GIE23805.1 DNA mismatch repair protein MutT [Actinoplanes humidus]